jgi:hypothetical protein
MLAQSLEGLRPTTVLTTSPSRSSHPHFSPLSLHSEFSTPGARTDLVNAAKFLPLILATRHSPLATASLSPFPATLTGDLQLTENPATLSPFLATLTSHVTRNSFVCHSCKKHPGWGLHPPSPSPLSPPPVTARVLSLPPVTSHQSPITKSFIIRTYEKRGGGGVTSLQIKVFPHFI